MFTVKGNTPTLRQQLKALPWKHVPAHSSTKTGHGKRVTRTIKVTAVPAWVNHPSASQVAQVRQAVTTGRTKSVQGST